MVNFLLQGKELVICQFDNWLSFTSIFITRSPERRNNTMYDLFIFWIALLLLVAVGTFFSTYLYTHFEKGNQEREIA
jgi:hypothetical protein